LIGSQRKQLDLGKSSGTFQSLPKPPEPSGTFQVLGEFSARQTGNDPLGKSSGWRQEGQPKQGGGARSRSRIKIKREGRTLPRGVKTRKPVRTLVNIDDFEGATR
jgi:hypothetical protein